MDCTVVDQPLHQKGHLASGMNKGRKLCLLYSRLEVHYNAQARAGPISYGRGGAFPPHPALKGGGGGLLGWGGMAYLSTVILNCCLVLFNCFDVSKGQGAAHHTIWPPLPPSMSCAIPFFLQPHDPCLMLLQ